MPAKSKKQKAVRRAQRQEAHRQRTKKHVSVPKAPMGPRRK